MRFIPARAGNMGCACLRDSTHTVHPRTCGEHFLCRNPPIYASGSSTHVRGTYLTVCSDVICQRFIPARAGNIELFYPFHTSPTVHPRTCGEHFNANAPRTRPVGSSPHVRGTCGQEVLHLGHIRFIPARAGNIGQARTAAFCRTVHPRTCGEHNDATGANFWATGSSPHVRGTYNLQEHRRFLNRFIPARAGNIGRTRTGTGTSPVHPRTCGEHIDSIGSPRDLLGSSPHVRGT